MSVSDGCHVGVPRVGPRAGHMAWLKVAVANERWEMPVTNSANSQLVVATLCRGTTIGRPTSFWPTLSSEPSGQNSLVKAADKRGQRAQKLASRLSKKGYQLLKSSVQRYIKHSRGLHACRKAQSRTSLKNNKKGGLSSPKAEELDDEGLQ